LAEAGYEPVEVVTTALLDGLPHGFLGRRGGVSAGAVAGLNTGLGAQDDPAAVAENRRRVIAAVAPGAQLATVFQVHSPDCIIANAPWPEAERPHADALVTDRPGLLLGVLTADCAPVLLADRAAGVIGAAHAGWKGALAGVTDRTIAAMVSLGARPDRIVAAIGPCIAQPSYEVDDGFRARFVADDPANARHFLPGTPGHWQFDLPAYVATRLAAAGISALERAALDTCTLEARFYSYRRSTKRGEATYGRQISVISLP